MGLKCVLFFQSTPINLANSKSIQSSHNKPVLRDPFALSQSPNQLSSPGRMSIFNLLTHSCEENTSIYLNTVHMGTVSVSWSEFRWRSWGKRTRKRSPIPFPPLSSQNPTRRGYDLLFLGNSHSLMIDSLGNYFRETINNMAKGRDEA